MAEQLLIGIDLGTTNGKVVCFDSEGDSLAEAVYAYPTHYPKPGWYEQDPNDWLVALEKGLTNVAVKLGSRVRGVSGLALSNFGPGLVLVGEDGESLAPCSTWQDERSRSQGERLIEQIGTDWIGLGAPLTGFPAKVLWAIEEMPEVVSQADKLLDIKGFLMQWLTGRAVTDPSSGPGALSWHNPVFDAAGWPIERLSQVMQPMESPGGLREDVANRVGLTPGTPVFTGVNDGAAATLGSGAINLSDSVITLATNGVARIVVSNRLDPNLILNRSLFSWPYLDNLWICGGFTFSGAGSLQWLADLFGLPRDPLKYDALLAEAKEVPIGSRGVVFLPYLTGRGSPEPDPDLRGGFNNISIEHGRAELTRAVLEGIAFALREIFDEFDRLNFEIGSVRITGGGSRSALWRQIIANVLNRPVFRAGGDATLGNAMIVAVGLGLYPDIPTACKKMVTQLSIHKPEQNNVIAYREVMDTILRTRENFLNARRLTGAGGNNG